MRNKNIKVLHVVRDIANTGGGSIAINIALKMQGYVGSTIVITDVPLEDFNNSQVHLIVIPFGELLNKWKTANKLTRTVRHLFQIVNFIIFSGFLIGYFKIKGYTIVNHNNEALFGDLITVHNVFTAELVGHPNGHYRGLVRLLNPVILIRVFKEQIYLRFVKKAIVIANSVQTKNELIKYVDFKKDYQVIPSGVDVEEFKFSGKYKLVENESRFSLLFVGHEFERKGLDIVINAISLLPKNFELNVVGGKGSSMSKYLKLVAGLGLNNRVKFWGSQNDLHRIYAISNVFILPSSYEGIPLVCLESMAYGLPNLLSCVGGMKELIKEGENGYFVSREPKNIAERILYLYSNPAIYLQMREKARESILEYSWENITRKYLSLIEKKSSNV